MAENSNQPESQIDEIMNRFNQAIGVNPALLPTNPALLGGGTKEQLAYNPKPVSADILKEITGTPFTGADPGLKNYSPDYAKASIDYLSKIAEQPSNPEDYMKPFSYNGDYDGANFERYYGTKQFNKLGFNPYRDNDALYNNNRTWGDDFVRAASQWPNLVKSGFMSGVRSWGTMFTDPLAPDEKGAREMQKAMAIGASTKKGAGAFFTNTFLNSGYTVGIGADLLAEELALMGITAATGGIAGAVGLPAMLMRAGRATDKIIDAIRVGEETVQASQNLNKISALRTAWNTSRSGLGKLGAALNPLENTWDVAKDIYRGTNELKYTKVGNKVDEFARWSDNFGKFAKDMLLVKSAVGEAKLEGGMVKMDATKELIEKYRQEHGKEPEGEELTKIENIASEEAKRTAFWNLPAILWSNKLMYETIFAPFEKGAVASSKRIVYESALKKELPFSAVGEGLVDQARAAGKALISPKAYGKFAMGYLKTNLAEGVQENLQEAISAGAISHAKALYDNPTRGAYNGYMSHFLTGMKAQISAQGAETFAGGFLMGAMAQPVMGAPTWTMKKVWDATGGKEKAQQYREERDRQVKEDVDNLNEFNSNPMRYFAPELSNLSVQDELAADMHEAINTGNKNKAEDIKRESVYNTIKTALRTGNYENILSTLTEFKGTTPKEAMDAFNLADEEQGAKVLSELDNIIARAKDIQKEYNDVTANFPNPYNPFIHPKGSDDFNATAYMKLGWDQAQDNLIFAKHSFKEHKERLQQLANALSTTSKPLANTSMQEIMPLLDKRSLGAYITSLDQQVKALDPTFPDNKKVIKSKTAQRELLEKFHNSLVDEVIIKPEIEEMATKEDKAKGLMLPGSYAKVPGSPMPHIITKTNRNAKGEITSYTTENFQTGEEVEVKPNEIKHLKGTEARDIAATLADRTSKKAFTDYLKFLAKTNDDFLFDTNIDKAYNIVKDNYLIKKEMNGLMDSINILNNPKGFLRVMSELAVAHRGIFEGRLETEKRMNKEFIVKLQTNHTINDFMQAAGIAPTEDYYTQFIMSIVENKTPPVPTEFIDITTGQTITSGEKFDKGLEIWNNSVEKIKSSLTEEVEEVKEEIKEEKTNTGTPTQTITPGSNTIDRNTLPYIEYPEELLVQIDPLVAVHINTEEAARNMEPDTMADKDPALYDGLVSNFLANDLQVKEIVDKYNSKVTQPAKTTAKKVEVVKTVTEPEVKTPVSDIEAKKADIEAAYDYITTRKYKYDESRKKQINKVGEELSKRFINILKEKGLIKEGFRTAPRTDGSYEKIKINEDLEGNNLGNDWNTAGRFKEEFRKFVDTELATLEKPVETTQSDREKFDEVYNKLNKISNKRGSVKIEGGKDGNPYFLRLADGSTLKFASQSRIVKENIPSSGRVTLEAGEVETEDKEIVPSIKVVHRVGGEERLIGYVKYTTDEEYKAAEKEPVMPKQSTSDIEVKRDGVEKRREKEIQDLLRTRVNGGKGDIEIFERSRNVAKYLRQNGKNSILDFNFLKNNSQAKFITNTGIPIEVRYDRTIGKVILDELRSVRRILVDKNGALSYDFEDRGKEIDLSTARPISNEEEDHLIMDLKKSPELRAINKKYDAELATLNQSVSDIKPEVIKATTQPVTSTVNTQQEALDKIKEIQDKTHVESVTPKGYVINGTLYPTRATAVATMATDNYFKFSELETGKIWLDIYDELAATGTLTPEALINKLKTDPRTIGEFNNYNKKKKVFFTPEKTQALLTGLNKDSSKASFTDLINELAYSETTVRGNTIDKITKQFLETGAVKKPTGITQPAFDRLLEILTAFKHRIESKGGKIITNNLVLHDIVGDGVNQLKVAGEMDVLVVTSDGKYQIFDIKTKDKWSYFNGTTTQKQYAAQLTVYKNLLEGLTGVEVQSLEIIPITTTTDDQGNITDIKDGSKQDATKGAFKLTPVEEVYEYVPKVDIQQMPAETPTTQAIKEYTERISTITDIPTLLEAWEDIHKDLVGKPYQYDLEFLGSIKDTFTTRRLIVERMINPANLKWAKEKNKRVLLTPEMTDMLGKSFRITSVTKNKVKLIRGADKYTVNIDQVDSIVDEDEEALINEDRDVTEGTIDNAKKTPNKDPLPPADLDKLAKELGEDWC